MDVQRHSFFIGCQLKPWLSCQVALSFLVQIVEARQLQVTIELEVHELNSWIRRSVRCFRLMVGYDSEILSVMFCLRNADIRCKQLLCCYAESFDLLIWMDPCARSGRVDGGHIGTKNWEGEAWPKRRYLKGAIRWEEHDEDTPANVWDANVEEYDTGKSHWINVQQRRSTSNGGDADISTPSTIGFGEIRYSSQKLQHVLFPHKQKGRTPIYSGESVLSQKLKIYDVPSVNLLKIPRPLEPRS